MRRGRSRAHARTRRSKPEYLPVRGGISATYRSHTLDPPNVLLDVLALHEVDAAVGLLLETFVGGELLKLVGWADDRIELLHFRDKRGNEVDFVLERRDRRIVGAKVKTSRNVQLADFRGLQKLALAAGDNFVRGLVLYGGTQTRSFGPKLIAAPIESLWADP